MDFSMQELCSLVGKDGQQALSEKTVSVVGLGGVGTTVAEILLRNGVSLRIVDKDRVYAHDMPRSTLYQAEDVTKFKAKQAKKRLEDIDEDIKVRTFHEELTEDNIFLLESDLIIDTVNNLKTSLLINKFAKEKKIPVIFCNYSGTQGNMVVLDHSQENGPCLACIQKKVDLPKMKKAGIFSPLTTFLAGLLSGVVMKQLMGKENSLKLLCIDIAEPKIDEVAIKKIASCDVCK